ncbi:hypothetical protein AOT82_2777 [Psychrobacter sp. AntiMn-1]|nr:hypothetical protein AOT82_2777 [Psychrobacter sp. AntiMn-1]
MKNRDSICYATYNGLSFGLNESTYHCRGLHNVEYGNY